MDHLVFSFDGELSDSKGVYLVSMENGLKSTRFLAEREIISEQIIGNPIPYLYGVKYNPLRFRLTLSCLDGVWTFEKRREIARWLDKQQYCEFYSLDNPSKVYYFMYTGGIDLNYDAALKGYIQLDMVNISPTSYSPVVTEVKKCLDATTILEIDNLGDTNIYPQLEITKVGAGSLMILNRNNADKPFSFTSLLDNETLTIDNQTRIIETDIPLTYRYDQFSGHYLELVTGVNRLEVQGSCNIKFVYQFEFKG